MNNSEKTVEIIYNGKPVALSYEEAITLAQKGMNYDKLSEKLEGTKKELSGALSYKEKIERLANALKITPEEFLDTLEKENENMDIRDFSEKNNIPESFAKTLKELEGKIETLEKEKAMLTPYKKQKEEMEQLKKLYPDIDERDIDPEIIKRWQEGDKPLADIYNEFMYKKLMGEMNAKKANEENQKASAGRINTVPEAECVYTDEDIRNMSDKEFNKNFSKILKHYKKGEM